jgi:hypothetical protein
MLEYYQQQVQTAPKGTSKGHQMPKDTIAEVIAEAERTLASTRYVDYWVFDPITRRRRISLCHIMRDDFTFCGLAIPTATATRHSPEDIEGRYSEMVCRRCRTSAVL